MLGRGQKLPRIGTAVGVNGAGFSTPNQLGAACAKVPPTAEREIGRRAVQVGIPTFHGVDAKTIANDTVGDGQRSSQGRTFPGGLDRVIDGQIQTQGAQVLAEIGDLLELGDFRIQA